MALVAIVAMLAVAMVGLLQRPLVLVVAIACPGVAIGAASYTLTRTGARADRGGGGDSSPWQHRRG